MNYHGFIGRKGWDGETEQRRQGHDGVILIDRSIDRCPLAENLGNKKSKKVYSPDPSAVHFSGTS